MSFVNLVSGGLDSSLIGVLAQEERVEHFPLFIDYGQRAGSQEWDACKKVHSIHNLPTPLRMGIEGFGQVIKSGLTDDKLDFKTNVFTPGRNLMFLLLGAAYAYQLEVSAVAIGLLAEEFSLFPDQNLSFIHQAEDTISAAIGCKIKVLTPLIEFTKMDVMRLARSKGVNGTYSCHTGNQSQCGECLACQELQLKEES